MSKQWRLLPRRLRPAPAPAPAPARRYSELAAPGAARTRNIGILAHIDAGKTTTTERMLYYSGKIRSMGEVHHGNTVTDYMEQERQRGITITSAAVSFPWRGHQINLIDTPGHIDFTMEVEQSLGVLDGAVIVLDASAGVEAQTLTVWRQTEGYRLPRLIYLNKMDRSDASTVLCLESIRNKLEITPLQLQLDVRKDDRLVGLIDIINLEEIVWGLGRGLKYTRRKLTEKSDGKSWEEAMTIRRDLVDTLSAVDDKLAETVIQQESLDEVNSTDIIVAVRNSTIQRKAYPVLCGSSYKNIGVQTLMDAVIEYVPSPLHCSKLYSCFENELSARAFKVQHDSQKGVLTYFRIFSGEISKGQRIYNLAQEKSEQTGPLYVPYADEYHNVSSVTTGNIAVVSGLKTTMTGDLVTSSQSAASRAKANLLSAIKDKSTDMDELILPSARQRLNALETEPEKEELVDVLLGIGTRVPDPVFLCSVEPASAAYQTPLETALAELQREDPSLRVSFNDETGQIILAGMGELHLDIIKERIIREYKLDVELGPLQIAYRETLLSDGKQTYVVDRKIASTKQYVKVTMSAKPVKGIADDKILRLDKTQDSASNLAHIYPKQLSAIRQGVEIALLHGPKLGCPMVDVGVTLHWLEVGRGTAETTLAAAVTQCLRKVFEEAEAILMEPVMMLEVVCPENYSARVMSDLSRRRTELLGINVRGHSKVIHCLAPLSELLGYSTELRSLSSGGASFTMEFHSNRQMTQHDEQNAIQSITGF